jgi:hypothetical protein
MRMFLKGAAIALALAGTALATTGTSNAAGIFFGTNSHRSGPVISIGFGDVAYGYRDGYWDRGHRWHRWSNDRDYRNYRGQHRSNYYDWNHDRDSNNGWRDR